MITKSKTVRLNLSLDQEVYKRIQGYAKSDYVRVSTWLKQLIMKNLEYDKQKLNRHNNE